MRRRSLVSVIIPTFNHGRFLREAIDSVGTPAAATEIVVVDDGSTDDTRQVLATVVSPNPLKVVRQENAGLAEARNRGLRESRGDVIIFLDADDRLHPGAIDISVHALQEHPECAFVFGRCRFVDIDGRPLPTVAPDRIVKDHYYELLRRNYIWMPAMVAFRRVALERAGRFSSDVDAACDYEMYLRIARHYPVFDHGRLVADYRRHEGNMSANPARMLRETLTVLRRQRPHLAGDPVARAAFVDGWRHWQWFYGDDVVTELRAAAKSGRVLEAASKAALLGRYHPLGLLHHLRRKTQLSINAATRRTVRRAASERG